ncbi:hypothetical protein Y1Q_0022561 [Alligator mississippiensis]|uniref:Uncharacterized protein n=1 Tax=Alligator mississippiensis TaxID=8496 RepID=A0A151NR45_ALLMI|nr:hypothetical protein Y1Q_0022561 [Alligator mississippiensis]
MTPCSWSQAPANSEEMHLSALPFFYLWKRLWWLKNYSCEQSCACDEAFVAIMAVAISDEEICWSTGRGGQIQSTALCCAGTATTEKFISRVHYLHSFGDKATTSSVFLECGEIDRYVWISGEAQTLLKVTSAINSGCWLA